MLWKKEKGIYENLCVHPDQMPHSYSEMKNNKKSSFFRKMGNASFQSNDFLDATDMYGESLIFAENGTEAVSLAYANRSACFFRLKKYDKCLIDIELAKQAGYTEKLMPKLEARKAECLQMIEQNAQIEAPTPTLDYEPNEKFPCMADVLEIDFDEKFGRMIKAKCDIPAGKIVLIERAEMRLYFHNKHKKCCCCLKDHTNTVPCKKCTLALFCHNDEMCMNNSYHKIECGMEMASDDNLSKLHMDVVRSILIALEIFPDAKDLMKFVEKAVSPEKATRIVQNITDDKQKYEAFLQLWYSKKIFNELWFTTLVQFVNRALLKKPIIKKKFPSVKLQRFLMHLIGHHFSIIYCNRGGIGYNEFKKTSIHVTIESLAIISSYINHSCAPNIDMIPGDDFKFCVTIRPIKMGEQLFVSYFRNDTQRRSIENKTRQDNLRKMFDFECECERCCNKHPTSAQRNAMKKDEAFDYITLNAKPPSKYSQPESTMMITKCLEFLNKYGHLKWAQEMEVVGDRYIEVLAQRYRNEIQMLLVE